MILLIDIILLIILLICFINGWKSGLVRMLAGLLGLFLGIVIAGHYFMEIGAWLEGIIGGYENLSKVIAFVVIFLAVNGVIGVGAYFVDKTFNILSFIPFLKTINSLAGAIIGLVGGIFFLGLLIILLDKFPLAGFILTYLEGSMLVPWLTWTANLILPLLPEVVREIKGRIGDIG